MQEEGREDCPEPLWSPMVPAAALRRSSQGIQKAAGGAGEGDGDEARRAHRAAEASW